MKIFGQPESYSDMLERIFFFTFGTGVFCVFYLSISSPAVKSILDSLAIEAEIGWIKGLKALYVVIPLIVAIFSRIIRLHDKISDVLLIRHRFDTKHILLPLSRKVGSCVGPDVIKKNRVDMMYKLFYPYAGFKDPSIDAQLVRSALDNWGWFWVELEAICLFLVTGSIFLIMGKTTQLIFSFVVALLLIAVSFGQYKTCIRTATAEVNAIVSDENRNQKILEHFSVFEEGSKGD